eukprot:CAMPEP_0114674606 /NCGR_PEP_ID=MMETSP0191-20121206/46613_1 /TAXON_ID=126664 /ORGANISM="Sorites sp." /LENGTH=93 /DNA_ID=CAMNT_0001942191 /DNA_START=172 /DNA_END=449 /DNA_ORIENTATION=+
MSISQQIITNNNNSIGIPSTLPDRIPTKITNNSIDNFVSAMIELGEPTGNEGNEVESPFDTGADIDWEHLTIDINENDDIHGYEALKRNTPST